MLPLDELVGARLRAARKAARLTQRKLANAMGVTYQQVQKYEAGKNRMSAGALVSAATTTGRPVLFFFADVNDAMAAEHNLIELWRATDAAGKNAIMGTASAVVRGGANA